MKKEINIEALTSTYETEQGVHAINSGNHFKAGCETILKLTENRLFSKEEMIECFNSARQTYRYQNGKFLDKHHSAESYVNQVLKKK